MKDLSAKVHDLENRSISYTCTKLGSNTDAAVIFLLILVAVLGYLCVSLQSKVKKLEHPEQRALADRY